MRSLDTQEEILGCDYTETKYESKSEVRLSLPEDVLNRLIINYGDDSFLGLSIKELARVYELVRNGKV